MSDADTIKAVTMRLKGLPPDPDGMNEARTESAQVALDAFMERTGVDEEDAVADLLANLQHWCDRNDQDFAEARRWGRRTYISETAA